MSVNPPIYVDYAEPHMERTRKILAAHPEVKKLFGHTPSTAFFVIAIVALQLGVAVWLKDSPFWLVFVAAYTVGALSNHALWTLIHECTHNLVFKTTAANSWLAIIANFPILLPSAMSFRTYHLKHHLYQGDPDRDADLARPWEARLIGNSALGKALWLLFFPVWQTARVPNLKAIRMFNGWMALNWVISLAVTISLTYLFGWNAFWYLMMSTFLSVGLHPVGARWIQEHFTVKPNQETYSYYGPLNVPAFNVGYHNEHHDLMSVPWSRLPKVKEMAPEFYESLHWHRSWTALLFKFIFDPALSLNSRVLRGKSVEKLLRDKPELKSRVPAPATV